MNKRRFIFTILFSFFLSVSSFAFEETITIPAEDPQGVELTLEPGEYVVEIAGGAIALFYPINPNYRWLIGVALGIDVKGGQDEPNLGTLYFEPSPVVRSQAEAEQQALDALKWNVPGTYLKFSLEKTSAVRFWVSDFDYTDNSGMVKLKIFSEVHYKIKTLK